jgi:hypothetical protein
LGDTSTSQSRGTPLGDGSGALLARLHEESDRLPPFSPVRLLLRQAASAIERLETEVARMTTELVRDGGT